MLDNINIEARQAYRIKKVVNCANVRSKQVCNLTG